MRPSGTTVAPAVLFLFPPSTDRYRGISIENELVTLLRSLVACLFLAQDGECYPPTNATDGGTEPRVFSHFWNCAI
jgi:hypothetical protein